jgi:hypothetical protein
MDDPKRWSKWQAARARYGRAGIRNGIRNALLRGGIYDPRIESDELLLSLRNVGRGILAIVRQAFPYDPPRLDGIAYGLLGPAEASELAPSKVAW